MIQKKKAKRTETRSKRETFLIYLDQWNRERLLPSLQENLSFQIESNIPIYIFLYLFVCVDGGNISNEYGLGLNLRLPHSPNTY